MWNCVGNKVVDFKNECGRPVLRDREMVRAALTFRGSVSESESELPEVMTTSQDEESESESPGVMVIR